MPKEKYLSDEERLLKLLNPQHTSFITQIYLNEHQESLNDILQIQMEELNDFGKFFSQKKPNQDAYGRLIDQIAKGINAYNQFQDLISLEVDSKDAPSIGIMFNRGYLYYESLVYLKNVIVSFLNANALCGLTLLRPFIELSIYFLYYKHMSRENGLSEFYEWFYGRKGKPPFANSLNYIKDFLSGKNLNLRKSIEQESKIIKAFYSKLSSYNHTPRVDESVGKKSGGFGCPRLDDIFYGLECLNLVLKSIVKLNIISTPMILFPVDVLSKFGFNWPVGLFADKTNYKIVSNCFDEKELDLMRRELATNDEVISLMAFYNSRDDLNENEIESTYCFEDRASHKDAKETLLALLKKEKVKFRSISWAMNYVALKNSPT